MLFGWYLPDKREFRLSLYPADAPIRPSIALPTREDAENFAERKRATIYWWPPLPYEV
jgi:hypothetical protein